MNTQRFVQLVLRLLTLSLTAVIAANSYADLRAVQVFTKPGEATSTVEITFTAPLKLIAQQPSGSDTEIVLSLDSQSPLTYGSWSSSSIDIDEVDNQVTSVELSGSHEKGLELRITFRTKVFVEMLPQYNANHVLLTIGDSKPNEKRLALTKDSDNLYAVTLESRLHSLPSLQDVPRSFASAHKVYVVPFTNAEGKPWQRLRIGVFESKLVAEKILAQLTGIYPDAFVSNISEAEAQFATNYRLNPEVALKRAQITSPAIAEAPVRVKIRPITPSNIDDSVSDNVTAADWVEPTAVLKSEWDALLARADLAFAKQDYTTAIPLYTKIVQQASRSPQQQALEKLGMSRELKLQIAHAKRNYEDYLARYPGTPGAERVRQRLVALLAITEQPNQQLRSAKRTRVAPAWQRSIYLSQYYRRQELEINDNDTVALDGIFTNANIIARRTGEVLEQEVRLSLAYLHDFTDRIGNRDLQFSSAYWDGYAKKYSTGVRIGRQSKYAAGVIGRFDGLTLRHDLSDQYQVGVVTGYLLDSSFDSPSSDRPFYGVFGKYRSNSGSLSISPYAIEQRIDGMIDRRALGFQTQWVNDSTMIWTNVDYDIYHKSLNNLTALVNFGIGKKSAYSLSFDQRMSPYLTTRNALIGQPFEELTELELTLIDLELKELASDRTATTKSARGSWNRTLNEHWQFSTDIIYTDTSSTDTSANVTGYEARDDIYYSMQLRANSIYGQGTYSALLARYADSDTTSTTTLFWNNRFSLGSKFWVYPRLRVNLRNFKATDQDQFGYVPSMRLDYRYNKRVRFEFELGYDTTTRETSTDDIDITGLFISAGYRALF